MVTIKSEIKTSGKSLMKNKLCDVVIKPSQSGNNSSILGLSIGKIITLKFLLLNPITLWSFRLRPFRREAFSFEFFA